MIVLFTDFGLRGPYVGQMKAILSEKVPDIAVIDLMHDAPQFNIKASAYLLNSLITTFPKNTIFLCVVDPGVGSERLPCVVKADDQWFVGPDNGLFNVVLNHAEEKQKWEIIWQPKYLSSSFHGRDLFAPIAADIAVSGVVNSNKFRELPLEENDWCNNLNEIIYIDHYGNAMTGLKSDVIDKNKILSCNGIQFKYSDVFSSVKEGDAFWYFNSNGLCELSVNKANAAQLFKLKLGDQVSFI